MRGSLKKRLLKFGLPALLVPVLVALVCYAKWTALDGRLVEVTEGAIYQSAALPPDDLVATCRELEIRTVIDLRDGHLDDVAAEQRAAAAAGIEHVHLPTLSHPTVEAAHAFLDALATAEKPVLVHCQHGEGRSVMMCAVHRIENEGWSNADAFDGTCRVPDELRFVTGLIPSLRRFRPETTKGAFVLNYEPRPAHRRALAADGVEPERRAQ